VLLPSNVIELVKESMGRMGSNAVGAPVGTAVGATVGLAVLGVEVGAEGTTVGRLVGD